MQPVRKVADRLIGLSAVLGALGLLAEMLVILVDVVGRAFGAPLFGSFDLTTMMLVIVVFGGMAMCDRIGGHVAVDILEDRLPAGFNRFVDILSAALGSVIFAVMAWAVYESAKLSLMLNLSTNLIQLPKAWFQWCLCGFAGLTALAMLLRAVELAVTGHDVRKERADAG